MEIDSTGAAIQPGSPGEDVDETSWLSALTLRKGIVWMDDATRLVMQAEDDGGFVSDELIQALYRELRNLAARLLAQESVDESLNPTALVHEAYLRLLGPDVSPSWHHRGHFFCAAANAMRRILIERARRRCRRNSRMRRSAGGLPEADTLCATPADETLEIVDAIDRLNEIEADAGELTKLRYFAGLTVEECAHSMGISRAAAYRHWSFARAWLHSELTSHTSTEE